MKVIISDLKRASAPIIMKDEINYSPQEYAQVFSLNKIKKVNVEAKCSNFGEIIEIHLKIDAQLVLKCSYSLEDVNYRMKTEEILNFSFSPINDEIVQIDGNEINLDDSVLAIIIANIPLRIKKKGAKPVEVEGVRVLSEDEYEKEKNNTPDARFSALDDWKE